MITGIAPFVGGSLAGAGSAAGLSTVLSGLGSVGEFAGAVGGLFGGKQKRTRYQDLIKGLHGEWYDPSLGRNMTWSEAQAKHERNMMAGRMADAEKYGISKLAMLGVPFSPSSPMVVGGGMDRDFGAIGQNIGRAAAALSGREERAMQARLTSLQVEGAQLDNDYKRSLIAVNLKQAGMPPGVSPNGAVEVVPDEVMSRSRHDNSFQAGFEPAHQDIQWNRHGYTVTIPNDKAMDFFSEGPASWLYQMGITIPTMLRAAAKGFRDDLRDAGGSGFLGRR